MLLPMGAGDDSAHSQNEKIDVRNYIEGVSTKINVLKTLQLLLCILVGTYSYFLCVQSFLVRQKNCNTLFFNAIKNIFFLFQTKLMAAYLYEVSKIKH